MLGAGFPEPGMRQFYDGIRVRDVVILTGVPDGPDLVVEDADVFDGEVLSLVRNASGKQQILIDWLPARQRLALGIPLHPDRMSREDWVTLPGIGEKLAEVIVIDRQKNGDFGSIESLERVRGIGPAKVRQLRPYFYEADNML